MSKRTIGLLAAALLVLITGILSCSISQVLATRLTPAAVPTRTPRPTWTRQRAGLAVATPTLDATRFPNAQVVPIQPAPVAQAVAPTPQMIVSGEKQPLLVPQPAPGQQVMTVVVVIVTATPVAPPSPTVGISTAPQAAPLAPGQPGTLPAPQPTFTLGPPPPTPTVTNTPPPPVMVHVVQPEAYVRQGPGVNYTPLTKLDKDTTITVVGRNHTGDWWKVCCINGSDAWIADSVVTVEGPLWTVPEALNIPPSPMPTPTTAPSPTPAPTPTFAWPFRPEGQPVSYPLGQNLFRVSAVIYDGSTPLWGYKLRIRRLATGEEWFSVPSETYWKYEPVEWGQKPNTPNTVIKRNVKWDSNSASIAPAGDEAWEVTVTDGANNPLSVPVRIVTSQSNPKWYYIVFTGRK
jgi:hypothetical protein